MGLTGFNKRRREAALKAKLAEGSPKAEEPVKEVKAETPKAEPVKEEVKEVKKPATKKNLRDE